MGRGAALRPQLDPSAAKPALEPTYSPAEVAEHFGVGLRTIHKLISAGRRKPYAGGLYPTFKVGHKLRRIPLSAIERHKRWMERASVGLAADQEAGS